MGLFDTVYFNKYCRECRKETEWSAQFKWEYRGQHCYNLGEQMWKTKVKFILDKKAHLAFRKEIQKKIKSFSNDEEGIATCEECERRYYEEYWKLKRAHWERTKCKGVSEYHYKKGKTYGKGLFKWKQKKDERVLFGICICGALERMLKRRKLRHLYYDCIVKIRNGVIKAITDFKKPDEVY